MRDYSMHYSYKGIGDVLIIIFDNEKEATRSQSIDRVTVIYHEDKIIGYNIFNIKDIVKIKNDGMIYLPTKEFIQIVNSILINAKLEPLQYKENSGFFTGTVKKIEDMKNHQKYITIESGKDILNSVIVDEELKIDDDIVVAKVGTRLPNGNVVKEYKINELLINAHICTYKELGIETEEDHILVLDKQKENGNDFFSLVEE